MHEVLLGVRVCVRVRARMCVGGVGKSDAWQLIHVIYYREIQL